MDFDRSLPPAHRLVLVMKMVRLATPGICLQDPLPLVFLAWEAWQGTPRTCVSGRGRRVKSHYGCSVRDKRGRALI